jgi:cysteinyl-tRNA synthetase
MILGFFRARPPANHAGPTQERALVEDLMKILISLRQEARQTKNFALGDSIRKKLAEINITLEDRPDGTLWRKEG